MKTKTKIRISKLLQIVLLFTFFLPFLEKCGGSVFGPNAEEMAKEQAKMDSIKADSIQKVNYFAVHPDEEKKYDDSIKDAYKLNSIDTVQNQANLDTTRVDTLKTSDIPLQSGKKPFSIFQNDKSLSDYIIEKLPLSKPILRPSENFSGLSVVLDQFQQTLLAVEYFAFVLFVFALVVKLKDFNNILLLMNTLGLIAHFSFYFFYRSVLWGYWLSLSLNISIILFDILIFIEMKKNRKKQKPENTILA